MSSDIQENVLAGADGKFARFNKAWAELVREVARIDGTDSWLGHGAGNLASFLTARWPISLRTARELVRDAKALQARPGLDRAMDTGEVSPDQARALFVLCEEGTGDDEVWTENLPFWEVEDLERKARKKKARDLERKDEGVYLRACHTEDERYLRGIFQLHPEDGAILISALDSLVPNDTPLPEWNHASALALVELSKKALEPSTGKPLPATVLVSVEAETLVGGEQAAQVATDRPSRQVGYVGAETARRLACDGRLQPLVKDLTGMVTATGPAGRKIPSYLRRAVLERDGRRCIHPGCGRTDFLEIHHRRHVADGGPTVLSNLETHCWTHHSLVHEGGWSLRGPVGRGAIWVRPDGIVHEPKVRAGPAP